MENTKSKTGLAQIYYALAISVLVLGGLYFCKPVLMPIALSVLLAFILNPLVNIFEGWRMGRTFSVLLASFMAFALIGFVTWAMAGQLKMLADELPNHTQEIKTKIESFKSSRNSTLGRLTGMIEEIFPTDVEKKIEMEANDSIAEKVEPVVAQVVMAERSSANFSTALEMVLPIVEPLATVALVIVLVLFLLLRREDMRYRVVSLMGDTALTGTTRLMRDTAERVSRYLLHLLLVNAAFGLWFGLGLFLIGVPYAPLWGALTLFLRFIPFLGSPASVLFPLLISIATSNGWSEPLVVLIFFSISELVTANIIEPVLFGKTTGLTPIALLIAALFWAWIWGPMGLLLSTPLTVCMVVLGQHIPQLRSLRVLLAEQPVLESRLQYFQRLLAQDKTDARRVFDAYSEEFGMEKSFDEVIVPALRWTRRERFKEVIDATEEALIWQTNNEILADLRQRRIGETVDGSADEGQSGVHPKLELPAVVYGYPVHHKSEEVGLEMLDELLVGIASMQSSDSKKLPSHAIAEISQLHPAIAVLAVMPPGGMPQAKYMCTEIRARTTATQVIVMYLGEIRDYDSFLVNLREAGAGYLTTTLAQTKSQIEAILSDAGQARVDSRHSVVSRQQRRTVELHTPALTIDESDEVKYVQ